jgi:hypothetical protein
VCKTSLGWAELALVAANPSVAEPSSAPAQRISAADFAALPIVEKPILSPDGHRVAARHVRDGETTLLVIDANNPEARARMFPLGKKSVYSLRWAGNHRLLITVNLTTSIGGREVPVPASRRH